MTAWTRRLADELDSLTASLSVSGVESPVPVANIRLYLDRLKEAQIDPHEGVNTLLSTPAPSATAGVRELLLEHPAIRDKLTDHGSLYMAVPRGHGSLSLHDIAVCLLKHAVVTSGIDTAEHFDRYLSLAEDRTLPCAEVTTVEGLRVDAPYAVFPGLTVLPLEDAVEQGLMDKVEKEDLAMRTRQTRLSPMACVVRSATFGPAFIPPQQRDEPHLTFQNLTFEWADEGLFVILHLLALANNSRVRMLDSSVVVPEFRGLLPFFQRARMPDPPRQMLWGRRGALTQDSVDELRAMFERLAAFPDKQRPLVELAARRLASALSRTDGSFLAQDSILDVSIALEILYGLSDGGEIQHKLATRLAHFLGESAAERYRLLKGVRSLYSMRSKVAHGHATRHEELDPVLNGALDLALASFSRLLERREFPSRDEWLRISVGHS